MKSPWFRSMLFVPGHKLDWMLKAPRYEPDALIFDLEDSVPVDIKAQSRAVVAEAIARLRGGRQRLFVRINQWSSGLLLHDLMGICHEGLAGVMLPKTESVMDIHALDYVLTSMEVERGLPRGELEIVPLCETATAMRFGYDICKASPRVRRINGGGAVVPMGDVTRALGCIATEEETETLYLVSKRILDARAAGVENILCAWGSDFTNPDALRRAVSRSRQLGANGGLAIHPVQIPILHEFFTPSREQLEEACQIMQTMHDAVARGDAAVRMGKIMIDYAHVRTARQLLERARSFGLDVPPYPDVPVAA